MLSTEDVITLSRWFDEVLPLSPAAREDWMAAHEANQPQLIARLRAMLREDPENLLPTQLPAIDSAADDAALAQPGELVGPYRLLRELGRGGMGAVWLAERADGIYERQVALKLPRLARGPRLAERMAQERRIGARLEHPHIARLYDAGIDARDRPYMVLEYVAGKPLLGHAQDAALGRAARIALLCQACDAVAHAHRQLIVHRDIKPSNLMVDAQGQLRLLDFGIAKLLDADDRTADGELQRTHTPTYAAPEQLRGEPVTTATDQYALAVVGHELLTGRRPANGQPDPALGRDAAAVLARALQARPGDRYPSVEHFADDLRRVVEGRPAATDPGSWAHRGRLLLRRHRAAAALAATAALALLIGGGAAWQQQRQARDEAQRAAQAREFLFDLLEDAEPLEAHGAAGQASGSEQLRAAVSRTQTSFQGQPALRGDVLIQLGLLLRHAGAPDEALQATQEGHRLLAASTDGGDAALARANAQLAQQMIERGEGELDEIETLARSAIADCRRDALRCAKARAYAEWALMQVALRRGQVDAALQHAESAVQANVAGFGENDPETVLSRLNLAAALRNGGRLPQAAQALASAVASSRDVRMRAADRAQLNLWQAVIAADLGRHADAIAALDKLIATPASASDLATWHRLRALSLLELQRWPAALAEAETGLALAETADDGWERALARQVRGRALSALGDHAGARRELDQAALQLQSLGLAEGSIERLRLQRQMAEAALRGGDLATAAALLAPLPAAHDAGAAAPRAPIDLAQVRLLQGTLDRLRGDLAAARGHDREAQSLLAALPAAHPLRRRLAVEMALVDLQSGGAAESLRVAARQWLSELPADAGNRQVLTRLIDDPASGRALVI
ncbi:MAG: protein kinase [Burkholderiaceae bacterium]|nr:protein kinase [Burkholderiaceae bacterium]